jgi:hypothetical protein
VERETEDRDGSQMSVSRRVKAVAWMCVSWCVRDASQGGRDSVTENLEREVCEVTETKRQRSRA